MDMGIDTQRLSRHLPVFFRGRPKPTRKRRRIAIAVLAIVASSLLITYWLDPGRIIWTQNGTVVAAHQYTNSPAETNWNVLVYIYQQNDMGYLVNTGYVALNGPGTPGHGNYCWNDGNNNCLSTPQSFNMNQALTVEALNNGNFMIMNHQ